jgi:thymidine phosphorylase
MAAGLSGLVMDVKVGNGAFMDNMTDATNLATALVHVACDAGLETIARITDMNQVLGSAAGNAVEVAEAIKFLTGHHRDPRLLAVVETLCAEMLVLAGLADDLTDGKDRVVEVLDNGRAAETFAAMVDALGGPSDILEKYDRHLPAAPVIRDVIAADDGVISAQATRNIGLIIVEMGGGRTDPADDIDHRVGITDIRPAGTYVNKGDVLAKIHARDTQMADHAIDQYQSAITIGPPDAVDRPVILDRIS